MKFPKAISFSLNNGWKYIHIDVTCFIQSLAQLVKNPPALQEILVQFLGREDPWRRDRLPTPVFLDFPCGSAGEESACNAGDLGLIPGLGRSPGEGKGYSLQYSDLENSTDSPWSGKDSDMTEQLSLTCVRGFPGGTSGKEPACQCRRQRDMGPIPGLGRSSEGGHGNPLQYSCLENPMDRGAWRATVYRVKENQTWLKQFSTKAHNLCEIRTGSTLNE